MVKLTKLVLLILYSFIFSSSYGQDKVVDSLQNVLNNYTKKDTIKVNLLNTIAAKIHSTEQERALKLLKESELLATDLNFKKGKANSLLYMGRTQYYKRDYKSSFNYYLNALTLYEELKNKEGIADCFLNIGKSYYSLSDFPKAVEYFNRSIATSEEAGKLNITSNSLMLLGIIHYTQGEYDKSLEYYKKAISIDEKINNKKGLSAICINLANLYKLQGNFTDALETYNKSLELKKQLGDEYGVATILNNIGTLYQEMENNKNAYLYYSKALPIFEKHNKHRDVLGCLSNIGIILMHEKNPKALTIFKKGVQISESVDDVFNIAQFTNNIAGYYLKIEQFDASLRYYEKAVKIHKQLGAQRELCNSYLNMGRIYYSKKEYDKALDLAREGNEIANNLKLLSLQTDYSLLFSKIYYAIKEYKLAYESSQAHKILNDSLYKKENFDKLAEIKYKYAYKDTLSNANKNVTTLKKSVAVTQLQKKWLIIGFIGLLIALAFLVILLKIRRVKMRNQQLLLEQKLLITQMNPHFIFNSIDNIQGLIYNEKGNDAINYLTKFSRLTRQILENSNENYISLSEEIEMIENYIALQQLLYNNKFDYEIKIESTIEMDSVLLPPMLTQPFIENAIKHGLNSVTEKGKINISFYLKDKKLFFEVSDNGKGFDYNKNSSNHKSLAMTITKERLVYYTKNQAFEIKTNNIIDKDKNVVGAQVIFEIPYIYEK